MVRHLWGDRYAVSLTQIAGEPAVRVRVEFTAEPY
jgi:hypothetical protein